MPQKPLIALSMGCPAGIGPELAIKLVADPRIAKIADVVVVGSDAVMKAHAAMLKLTFKLPVIRPDNVRRDAVSGHLLADVGSSGDERIPLGKPSGVAGDLSVACMEAAFALVKKGVADALVTGPINKQSVGLAGFKYAGHTDFLAERTGAKDIVMMLVGGGLRVGLVTHHIAVADVPKSLTTPGILAALRIMNTDMKRFFRIEHPRIAVAGLNPHASDGGRFGSEEFRIIEPAIAQAKAEGITCDGPHPPDTVFVPKVRVHYDAILAMYHDQGLIPLKMLAFGSAVNVTLGLPIIRTSVDHGTAYDIVGKGVASTDSLVEAVKLAVEIVGRIGGSTKAGKAL